MTKNVGVWLVEVESGPPPYKEKYADDQKTVIEDGQPPTYESVYGDIVKTKRDSDNNTDFANRMCQKLMGTTIWCVVVAIFLLAVPVASTVIGALYLYDCPRQPYIPIYLLVAGSCGILLALIYMAELIRKRFTSSTAEDTLSRTGPTCHPVIIWIFSIYSVRVTVSLFLFAWFITGSVWVYSMFGDYQHEDSTMHDYCHNTLYLYTFWVLTAKYIIIALHMLMAIFIGIFICIDAAVNPRSSCKPQHKSDTH